MSNVELIGRVLAIVLGLGLVVLGTVLITIGVAEERNNVP